jgi:phosphate:Na+ symporter
VDQLHGHIVTYLGRISQESLDATQTEELMRLMEATNDLENIGDVLSRDLGDLAAKRTARGVSVSPQTREVLAAIHADVQRALSMALQAVTQKNVEAALVVTNMKPGMKHAAGQARRHEAARLVADEPGRLDAYRLETDIIESLTRIYYFTKRMARGVVRGAQAAEATTEAVAD